MHLRTVLVVLLFANCLAHFIQYGRLKKQDSPNRWPALIFADINLILAIFLFSSYYFWLDYLVILFTLISFIGLCATLQNSTGYKAVNYLILGLDALIIGITNYLIYLL